MLPLIAQRDLQHHVMVQRVQNLALPQLARALLVDLLELVLVYYDYLKLVELQVALLALAQPVQALLVQQALQLLQQALVPQELLASAQQL
jgi:hypothetical protein